MEKKEKIIKGINLTGVNLLVEVDPETGAMTILPPHGEVIADSKIELNLVALLVHKEKGNPVIVTNEKVGAIIKKLIPEMKVVMVTLKKVDENLHIIDTIKNLGP